ncbi:bifunctional glycosyltransferase family 2 protein/CDP-glycerol:glycerophosphate glycerophosphotransferase [Anaerovorax odorimutans]|uniref:Bifunctional glycosyltransferase family 2 protein/CDP-glycerol:glycerophosphate glycerophosphotransferase n=1 Tax=Anaerovorax odorimutans TaxID=109327 RepID=A0ABT1RJ98_9FIRM|nr:CDP-glycerol glycerophosphotransferase family protein [Anaerovorax odorimutans]MCQ4635264.1 bifunctional glycosyltransferase family 2 protein/CDP-glycerol:glycerophosphate glycerophosphotransferase [Anaerovorax odorimutans]
MKAKISVIIPVYNVENYIEKMLESVRNQTFTDFEVIIINDGSSDGSQQIIDRFCREDERFHSYQQPNGGVSSARNKGLEMAGGEYVVFYDPDDYIPEDALKAMFTAAKEELADLIIGKMELFNLGESYVIKPTEALAKQKKIDVFDKSFNWSFSVCNKMFRREVIEQLHLRFEALAHGEDGVFLFQFVHGCKTITGCKEVVYHYLRRPFWEGHSVTQSANLSALEDLLTVFKRLISTVEGSYARRYDELKENPKTREIELEAFENTYRDYRSNLYARFVQTSLLGEYYRLLWKLELPAFELVEQYVRQFKDHIFPQTWKSHILERNKDLSLQKKLLLTADEVSEMPVMSFVLSDRISENMADLIVAGLYNQEFPAFEILAHENLKGHINEAWTEKKNFHFISKEKDIAAFKKNALNSLKGEFVNFIDEDMIVPRRLIKQMYDAIAGKGDNNSIPDFITVSLKQMTSGQYRELQSQATVFIKEFVSQKIRTPYNQLDWMWGNKLFHVQALKAKKVLFSNDPAADMNRLYNNSRYKKVGELSMVTTMSDSDILVNVKSHKVKLFYKHKLKQEAKRLEALEKEDLPVVTLSQRFRRWKNKTLRQGYKFITRKIVFPIQYRIYSRKPVEENKVIFVEARLKNISNSMIVLRNRFEQLGGYQIHDHFLRQDFARYRQQYRNASAFVKDMATAKFVFVAEANNVIGAVRKRKETTVVQTWHGCGAFKRFGFSTADYIFGGTRKQLEKYPMYKNFDLITVSSPEVVWAYKEAMNLDDKDEAVKPIGVSRTDVFFDQDFIHEARERIYQMVPQARDKKILLYAPTFRGRVAKATGPDNLDVGRLAEALTDEYVLLIKHHPIVKNVPEIPMEYQGTFAIDVTRSADIEDLLCAADICISDYSSLVFEYSLFGKPMIFFAYDLDTYFDWRGFYYDYHELAPGPVLTSTEEIIHYIRNLDTMFDQEKVQAFRERFMRSCDGHATDRILETILKK